LALAVREGSRGYHAAEELGESRGQSAIVRLIVGILWIVLMVFIVLVLLNTPGIR